MLRILLWLIAIRLTISVPVNIVMLARDILGDCKGE